jgi:hypothetical protein
MILVSLLGTIVRRQVRSLPLLICFVIITDDENKSEFNSSVHYCEDALISVFIRRVLYLINNVYSRVMTLYLSRLSL